MAAKSANSSTKKSHDTEKVTVKATVTSGRNKFFKGCKTICKNLKSTPIVGLMLAEFIGTMILTIAFIQMQSSPIFLGFAVVGITLLVGGISGAHLNPAMTVGAWVTRKIKAVTALGFIAAQVLGATIGWLIVKGFFDVTALTTESTMFTSAVIPDEKEWFLFFAELLGATILGLGIAASIRLRKNRIASSFLAGMSMITALYIVMATTEALLTVRGTTLTFLNPTIAGVIGVFNGNTLTAALSIYVVAPVIGAIIGFGIYELMQATTDCSCDNSCVCEKC